MAQLLFINNTACQSKFDSNEYHMLLLKNPQFLSNHYKTLSKYGTHEYLILTKFRKDWIKIVDFLIKAYVIHDCQICFVALYITILYLNPLLSLVYVIK